MYLVFFFFNDTATTEIYTLSLHDALPISTSPCWSGPSSRATSRPGPKPASCGPTPAPTPCWPSSRRSTTPRRSTWPCSRSEEHTSELQSRQYLVCRLLLEKKKIISNLTPH